MNTQNTKTVSFDYPIQPVHHELVERLYTEVDRLACRAARQSYLPLPQDLDSRMVAATLRYLDQQGVCLSPRTPEARAELQKRALYTLHYRWNKTTLRDYKRASQKAFIESLETKVGDAWEPMSDIYGNSCEDATPFPGEDLLAGETGRLVLAILKREFELTEESHDPIAADGLAHFYDHKLRSAIQEYVKVREEEEQMRLTHNERAAQLDTELNEEEVRVNQEDLATLAQLAQAIAEAHLDAGRKVAEAKGSYDPKNPSEAGVLRLAKEDERSLAAEMQMPWTPADKDAQIHKFWGAAISAVVGIMVGLSLGILSGFVPAGNWLSKPIPLGVLLSVGIASAFVAKFAIKLSAREASLRYWLGKGVWNWIFFAVMGISVPSAVVYIDSLVEKEGLMANVRMQEIAHSMSGQTSGNMGEKERLYYIMAVILTIGYVINAFWEGYLSGRYDACLNRINREQGVRFQQYEAARRDDPKVQVALDSVSHTLTLLGGKASLEARTAGRTAKVDAQRLSHQAELSLESKRRIQDALDEVNGSQATFDVMLEDAKLQYWGGGGFWQRLFRALRGGPRLRQNHRERKRPLR